MRYTAISILILRPSVLHDQVAFGFIQLVHWHSYTLYGTAPSQNNKLRVAMGSKIVHAMKCRCIFGYVFYSTFIQPMRVTITRHADDNIEQP